MDINFNTDRLDFYQIASGAQRHNLEFQPVLQSAARQNLIKVDEADLLKAFVGTVAALTTNSSSQLLQDMFAAYIVGDNHPKTFLEFGATDGVSLSNSYRLENDLGWKGVLCEPSPQWHQNLFSNRPDTRISTLCVWKETGQKLSFFVSDTGVLSTLSDFKESDRLSMPGNTEIRIQSGKDIEVETISLNDLIEKEFAGVVPSYISVDTEGSEFEIIREFDFGKYRPLVWTVEHNHTEVESQLDTLMQARGYVRVLKGATAFDAWYVAKEALEERLAEARGSKVSPQSDVWRPGFDLFELVELQSTLEIVDVGAAMGETPVYQGMVNAGRARVVGFEPNQEECERLSKAYDSTHRFLPYFLGDGEKATFHETNWSLTGSLFEPNTPLLSKFQNLAEMVTPVARHSVDTTRLDDVKEIEDIDFLKIDVQGSELAVFKGGPELLSKTLVIQAEVNFLELYKGMPMFSDVDEYLRSVGFQFHTFCGFGQRCFKPLVVNNDVNAGMRQHIWSDAIYVRDWMSLSDLSLDKLKKYAVLAHIIIGSYDLAHMVFAEIDRRLSRKKAEAYLRHLAERK